MGLSALGLVGRNPYGVSTAGFFVWGLWFVVLGVLFFRPSQELAFRRSGFYCRVSGFQSWGAQHIYVYIHTCIYI